MNLNQVTLPATNLAQSVDFYLKMGFTQIVDSREYARFSCPNGGSTFSLALSDAPFNNGSTIYFESEDLDGWIERLVYRGLVLDHMPVDQPYLWREAKITDPSGNQIILFYAGPNRLNPPWQVHIKYGEKS